jgi:hypothetical protein
VTTTIGVLGGKWRAQVTGWGDLELADGRTIAWYVAADDRWHRPADEETIRQTTIDGTPVVETKLRVPGGDAIQRIWAVADHGGLTVIEVENDSPMPIAVALSGGGLLTNRPPTDVPIEGIDLPADSIVLPVGHRTRVRAGIPHGAALPRLPDEVAGPNQVAGGWLAHTGRASRVVGPDDAMATRLVAARCALALDGPDAADDASLLAGIGELVRMGEPAELWMLDVVETAQRLIDVGRRARGSVSATALWAAADVLALAGEDRGAGDIVASIARLGDRAAHDVPLDGPVAMIREVEDVFARPVGAGECRLFPAGIPPTWWGQSFEGHGLRAGPAQRLSFAVRWHGERPAMLWEVDGPGQLTLTGGAHDPSWRNTAPTGEALLKPPR